MFDVLVALAPHLESGTIGAGVGELHLHDVRA
jgi:hypothetical protein